MVIIKSKKCSVDRKKFNSVSELKTYLILKRLFLNAGDILANIKIPGSRKEIDIFIPSLKIGFEIQGPSHNRNFSKIHDDLQKLLLCKRLGIKLYFIPYNKITEKYIKLLVFKKKDAYR